MIREIYRLLLRDDGTPEIVDEDDMMEEILEEVRDELDEMNSHHSALLDYIDNIITPALHMEDIVSPGRKKSDDDDSQDDIIRF